jgi:alpha-mannosidase
MTMRWGKYILAVLLFSRLTVDGQETVKHLYLANDTHTDLMWNGDEDDWYGYNLDMAKFYLTLGEESGDRLPEARSKWNYDVAWTLYMLEKRTPEAFFNRIIEQLKNGQASVPYNFTLAVYGASSLESILRSFYFGGHLERRYGIDIDLAVCQENATLPLGLASLWAGSGAKYSWRGVCNCATQVNTVGYRDHEIYWYTGLDGSRILMKWYSNFGWNAELGGYSEMLEPTVAVLQMDSLCGSKRYPYSIAGAFGKGWDNIHNYSYDLLWGLKHRTLPNTKLFLSNESDFFQDFESHYGENLPEVTLSFGNEWDLNLASLAEVSGKLKRSMEKLRTAEAMAAFVSVDDSSMLDVLKQKKEDFLYGIGVYNLHGWTADGPVNRHDFASYMRHQQQKVTAYADALYALSASEMGKRINADGLDHMVFVFNALNWERKGMVDIPLEKEFNGVRDPESGDLIVGHIVEKEGSKFLRIFVDKIPSTGYRVYQLSNGIPGENHRFQFTGNTLETPYYIARITRSGAISSLFDKQRGKDWAEGLLNDLGSSHHDNGDDVLVVERGEQFIALLCRSEDPVKHQSLITFYADDPRVDIQNIIQQNFDDLLHNSFHFNIEDPEVWHEETGAVIMAKLASAGGHYADRMARYDYLTLNHFVNAGNDRESITLSNADCLFFRLGNSTPGHLDMNSSTVHVLVGGQVNKDQNLGIIKQDGDTLFHQNFSLLPHDHAFDAGESMRFALEHQTPLSAGFVSPGGKWPGKMHSFLKTDDDNVILWALKPGEEGGLTMRLWNMGSGPVASMTSFSRNIQKAFYATHVETNIASIPSRGNSVALSFNQHQLKTYRIWLGQHVPMIAP